LDRVDMIKYNFSDRVNREGIGSLKERETPENIKAEGLISYWGAEFEFPTCEAFSNGIRSLADRGLYGFTIQDKKYNEHVKWWMENVRNWDINDEWIVPAMGIIFGLATAIRMFVRKDENIIILQPTYGRYKQAADRIGVKTIVSNLVCTKKEKQAESAEIMPGPCYEIDWTDLESKMSNPANRLLVLCNPNNPTGTIFKEEELRKIAALSKKYNVLVYCDEIFAEIVPEGGTIVPYGKIADEDALAITCTSMGKCMSITGFNHANLFIKNAALRERYNRQKYSDHYGSLEPLLYAGLCSAYTSDGKKYIEQLCKVIHENVTLVERTFEMFLPKAKVIHPEATYVLWIDYTGLGMSDEQLETFLNDEALFYGDAGTEYGATKQFYRYSVAVPTKDLKKSMEYLIAATQKKKAE